MSIGRLEPHEDYLRVHFAPGAGLRHADFHWFWLRHNSDLDRHPLTHERIVCSSELPAAPRPQALRIATDASALEIDWGDRTDGRASRCATEWLQHHAYAPDRAAASPPPSDATVLTLEAAHLSEPLGPVALGLLDRTGASVVRGYGLDTEALIATFG